MDTTDIQKKIPAFMPKDIDVNKIVYGKSEEITTQDKVKVGRVIPVYYKDDGTLYYLDIELHKTRFPFGVDRKTLKKSPDGTKYVTANFEGKPKINAEIVKGNKRHDRFRNVYESIENHVRQEAEKNNELFFGKSKKQVNGKMIAKSWRSQIKISKNPDYNDNICSTLKEFGKDKVLGTTLCDGDNSNAIIKNTESFVCQSGMKNMSGTSIVRIKDIFISSDKKLNCRNTYETIQLFKSSDGGFDYEQRRTMYKFVDETDDEDDYDNEEETKDDFVEVKDGRDSSSDEDDSDNSDSD
jgi:hypothetical protein